MKNQTITKIILSLVAVSLFACGKNPSSEDRVKQELKHSVSEKERTLTPLAGRYEGKITRPTGDIMDVVIQLIPTIMIVQNPGRNDVTEMPTLGGNVNLYFKSGDKTDVIPIAQFTNSMYDEGTGRIRLNGSINTGTSLGTVLNTFDGYILNGKLTGHLSNTTRGDLGMVEASKVTESEAEQ